MSINDLDFEKFIRGSLSDLMKSMQSADQRYSKIIINVATGAFAVSITFLTGWHNSTNCKSVYFLIISWVFLGLTIVLEALGYYLSRKNNNDLFKILNKKLADPEFVLNASSYNTILKDHKLKVKNRVIDIINRVVLIVFIIGVISLIFFAIFSLIRS